MKSKKKPLVAAAISALLALAGTASAQATGGSTDKQAGTGRKGRSHRRHSVEFGKKATKHYRSASGKKATKVRRHRRGGRKGKKSSGGTTTQPPK
jgi:hypothetical protein